MNIEYSNADIAKYRKVREAHKKHLDRDRLKKVGQQKIKTTMIGSIASLEYHLKFLWEGDEELTAIFNTVRSEILDKGNNQMRNFEAELNNYEVTYSKPMLTLPVKELGNEDD